MINLKRHKKLLELLDKRQTVSVEEFVEYLNASPATVRRDISWLAQRNMLIRIRGGAEKLKPADDAHSITGEAFRKNLEKNVAEKCAISRYAANLINDGETIIINGGSTTYHMTHFLKDKKVKIITNSFLMAEKLLSIGDHEIIIPGGQIYKEQNIILSPFESDVMQYHYANKMFMSVYGISSLGLMESDPLLVQAEKRLMNQASQLIVLVDSSKFSQISGLILCELSKVDVVITDSAIREEYVLMLESLGIQVHIVASEPCPDHF